MKKTKDQKPKEWPILEVQPCERAEIVCHRTQHSAPTGEGYRYEIRVEWKGDTKKPALVYRGMEREFLEWAPWPLVKAGETFFGDGVYFRRDTNPLGAPLWVARQYCLDKWIRFKVRFAWTMIVWGVAKAAPYAVAHNWPIERWVWQNPQSTKPNPQSTEPKPKEPNPKPKTKERS